MLLDISVRNIDRTCIALHGVDQIIHGPETEHRIQMTAWGSPELDLHFLAHIALHLWDIW